MPAARKDCSHGRFFRHVDYAPAPGVSGAPPELTVLVAAIFGPAQDHFTAAPGTGDAVLFFPERFLHLPGMRPVSLERRTEPALAHYL